MKTDQVRRGFVLAEILFLWFLLGITLAVTFLLGYVRGCNAEITREYNRIHADLVASEGEVSK